MPWHRVISSNGKISLKSFEDCQYQKNLLEQEGIKVLDDYKVDLDEFLWKINSTENL